MFDPGWIQLIWLRRHLEAARNRGERVLVVGHVPPSTGLYHRKCWKGYMRLMMEFADARPGKDPVVVGQYFGHANVDHFFFVTQEDVRTFPDDGENTLTEEDPPMLSLGMTDGGYIKTLFHRFHQISKTPPNASVEPFTVVNVAPSVIPTFQPSLRLVRHLQGRLLGYTQYWANLKEWNAQPASTLLKYEVEYDTS